MRLEKAVFERKNDELKLALSSVCEELGSESGVHADFSDMAVTIFDLTQRAADTWRGAKTSFRCELLEVLTSHRTLGDSSLYLDWRKPFDSLARQPVSGYGVDDRIRTGDLLSHSQAL